MKKPLIIIAGPTACGKTDLAIGLAQKIGGEIISADSMQVYKYMDIGTAKPSKAEMAGIPHYLIDELYPDEPFNAMIFQQRAKAYAEQIYGRGKTPILVGGTGFYINAFVYNNDFMSTDAVKNANTVRERLEKEREIYGNEYIHDKLKAVDPEYAVSIHANNSKRVIRALEYYEQTGQKLSEHNKTAKAKEAAYNVTFVVLSMDREKLYERINQRVDLMMANGLLEEVQGLLDRGYSPDLVAMQGLGYKEFIPYLKGEISLEEAVETLKKRTRNFAKRQLTWFRNQNPDALWFDLTKRTREEAVDEIIAYYKESQ